MGAVSKRSLPSLPDEILAEAAVIDPARVDEDVVSPEHLLLGIARTFGRSRANG
jgi:hypothetical protein